MLEHVEVHEELVRLAQRGDGDEHAREQVEQGQHVQEQEDQEEQDHQARLHPEVAKLKDVMKMKVIPVGQRK